MRAKEHSDFNPERERLAKTYNFIQQELSRPFGDGGVYRSDRNALIALYNQKQKEYRDALQSAYFGRVDIDEGKNSIISYYVGKYAISSLNIYSWAAPQIKKWYSGGRSEEILLRREYQIKQSDLNFINDLYVDPRFSTQLMAGKLGDSLLIELLKQNKSGKLHDMVATIQDQQFQIIQSPLDQLLVIQGVAGSGKSSIALERVAYLLYNHREKLQKVVVLGPSRMFMGYVAGILPALGESNIIQKSVDDWFLEKLETSVAYDSIDVSIEMLLSPEFSRARKLVHFNNAKLKGSLSMAKLLEHQVHLLDVALGKKIQYLECEISQISKDTNLKSTATAKRSAPEIRSILDKFQKLPLNLRIDEAKRALITSMSEEIVRKIREDMEATGGLAALYQQSFFRQKIQDEVAAILEPVLADWRHKNNMIVYRDLLANPDSLREAGQEIFDSSELALMSQETPGPRRPYKFSDLPALLYLKLLLDGTGEANKNLIDHLVLDEAQDLSPLTFKVLSCYMRTKSITVLGDTAQGIYSQSGIHAWDELEQAFNQKIQLKEIRETYRSTQEITDFANKLLSRIGVNEKGLAIPIARPGPSPKSYSLPDRPDSFKWLLDLVKKELNEGRTSIALIHKTAAACTNLANNFRSAGFNDFQLLTDRNTSFTSGVAIIPAYLSKGLEFDVVIIADADATTYPADELSKNLLYVALTRASHILHIYHTGQITPFLDSSLPSLQVLPALQVGLNESKLTVAEYVAKNTGLDLTECIEYLASIEKLFLLADGPVSEMLLDNLLLERQSEASDSGEHTSQPISITSEMLKGWIEATTATQAEPAYQEQMAFVNLIYGFVSTKAKTKKQQTEGFMPVSFEEQIKGLIEIYQTGRFNGQVIRTKWIDSQEVRRFFQTPSSQIGQNLIIKYVDQGLIEEEFHQNRTRYKIPQESLRTLVDQVIRYLEGPKLK